MSVLGKWLKCQRKVRYGHEATAAKACMNMARRYGDATLEAYRCQYCDGWHIGHPARRFRFSVQWGKQPMTALERCYAEQAACAEYLADPAKLAAHAAVMRCTIEQERFGLLLGFLDWGAEADLIRGEQA